MDDFRLEDLDNFDLLSAEKVANKYGGDKRKIGEAAQMGLINPTVAVMAGMFIDRMRSAAIAEQKPTTTVAQDVMAPATQMAGLGATPQAQTPPQMPGQAPTQMAAASAMPTQTATLAEGGLAALPVDEDMFPDEYAGGGIVAFETGGPTTPFGRFASEFGSNFRNKTAEELEILKLQDELRGKYGSASSLPGLFMSQTDEERQRAKDIMGRLTRMDVNELRQLTESKNRAVPIDQLSQAQQTGTDSIDALRAKAAASRAGISNPEDRARYDENISGMKRIADNVAPKTEAKATEAKATEGVNVKAADKALTDYAKKVKEINKEFGVSDEPDAKTRAALEKYKEKLNKDLDKAGALGLVSAGLGIAGGKSQYALQNLAGAAPAIEQYSKAMSQIRESEKGILDSEAKLDQAADARARGNVKLALELEKDAKDLAARERQAAAAEKQALKPSQFAEQYSIYAADEKAAGRTPSFEGFRKTLGSGDENIDFRARSEAERQFAQQKLLFGQIPGYKELRDAAKGGNPEAVKKLQEFELKQYNDILNRIRGSSPTAGAGVPADIAAIANKYK
jgi:hypothetical protein